MGGSEDSTGKRLGCPGTLVQDVICVNEKVQSATRREDGHPVLLFELTVRGIGNYTTLDEMWNWFALAHEWVVRGFTDLIDRL